MNINLQELAAKGKPVTIQDKLDVSELLKSNRDVLKTGELQAVLKAEMAGDIAKVEGPLSFEVELQCSRCLSPLNASLELEFEEFFTAKQSEVTVPDSDDDLDDEEIHYCPDGQLDLKPYIDEYVLLGIPFVPLCREDCKGLCPVCGTDRNVRDCGCRQERIDPRLAGLKDLLDGE